jgi:hypothetical protein
MLIVFFFITELLCFCQQLTYKRTYLNENNTKLSNQEVKELQNQPELLASYSAGQTKASVEDSFRFWYRFYYY